MIRIAFGLKAHSGWAALVALESNRGALRVLDRCRLELVDEREARWAKQPYHAVERSSPRNAQAMVARAIRSAERLALRELRAAVERLAARQPELTDCALLVGAPMPDWTVTEILAVHFRMHKAEGQLFRDALAGAASACGLRLVPIPEKGLDDHAAKALATPAGSLRDRIATLGKSVGPPWGKDQKDAALAAWIALATGGENRGFASPDVD